MTSSAWKSTSSVLLKNAQIFQRFSRRRVIISAKTPDGCDFISHGSFYQTKLCGETVIKTSLGCNFEKKKKPQKNVKRFLMLGFKMQNKQAEKEQADKSLRAGLSQTPRAVFHRSSKAPTFKSH